MYLADLIDATRWMGQGPIRAEGGFPIYPSRVPSFADWLGPEPMDDDAMFDSLANALKF